MQMNKKITSVIPAYNEEFSIGYILRQLSKTKQITYCVVVNDGSTDKTASKAKRHGAIVISHDKNQGTGRATQTGLLYALQKKSSSTILLDADGQHDPVFLSNLLEALNDQTDIVIGSRYIKRTAHSTSFLRRMGTKIISFLIFFKYGKRIHDPTSGYRVLNTRALKHFASHYPHYFSEPEVVIEAIKQGMKIREVSIQMKPRLWGKSTINLPKAFQLMFYITQKILSDDSPRQRA